MAAIPGSVPLTGKVAPTDTTDTFATHMDIYGEGGYMSVADTAARNLITEDRRKLGMAVCTTTDNKIYTLTTEPGGATTIDANWTEFSSGGNPDLQDILDEGTDASNLPYSGAVYSTSDSLGFLPTNSVVIGNGDLPTGEAAYVGCIYNASPMHNSVNIWAQHDTSVSNNDGRVLLYAKNANGITDFNLSGDGFTLRHLDPIAGGDIVLDSTPAGAGKMELRAWGSPIAEHAYIELNSGTTIGPYEGYIKLTASSFGSNNIRTAHHYPVIMDSNGILGRGQPGGLSQTVTVVALTPNYINNASANYFNVDLSGAPSGAIDLIIQNSDIIPIGSAVTIQITQGPTLPNTLVWSTASPVVAAGIKWEGATPLTTPTQVNGAIDIVTLVWNGTYYLGSYGTNFV